MLRLLPGWGCRADRKQHLCCQTPGGAGEASHRGWRQLLIGQPEVVRVYLSQGWDVLQPSVLQARLPDGHALVGAPHVGAQQLAHIPLGRNVRPRLQSIQVSTWVPLHNEQVDWSGIRRLFQCAGVQETGLTRKIVMPCRRFAVLSDRGTWRPHGQGLAFTAISQAACDVVVGQGRKALLQLCH